MHAQAVIFYSIGPLFNFRVASLPVHRRLIMLIIMFQLPLDSNLYPKTGALCFLFIRPYSDISTSFILFFFTLLNANNRECMHTLKFVCCLLNNLLWLPDYIKFDLNI